MFNCFRIEGQVYLWVEGIQWRRKVIKTKTYNLVKEIKRQGKRIKSERFRCQGKEFDIFSVMFLVSAKQESRPYAEIK